MPRTLAVLAFVACFALGALVSRAAPKAKPPAPSSGPAARVAAARTTYQAMRARLEAGTARAEDAYVWSTRWLTAARAAGEPSAAKEHLARMQELETAVGKLVAGGLLPATETSAAEYYRLEAEAWLGGQP
jgi:hypothetical protein